MDKIWQRYNNLVRFATTTNRTSRGHRPFYARPDKRGSVLRRAGLSSFSSLSRTSSPTALPEPLRGEHKRVCDPLIFFCTIPCETCEKVVTLRCEPAFAFSLCGGGRHRLHINDYHENKPCLRSPQNDTSFSLKQHVVFLKTTRRFL